MPLPPPAKGATSPQTRAQAIRDASKGKASTKRATSRKRSRATAGALRREGTSAASRSSLARQARATFVGAEVTPYLFQAGTDAGAWRNRGVPVYGIYPYPITAEELTRMHGNDERVSVESLRLGTDMIYKTLVEVAGR